MVESKNYIPAVVCARAAQETFAVIAYLSFKFEEFESTKDLSSLLKTMRRLSIGWRGDAEFPEMVNILTCIDHVSKKLDPEFRRHYDLLSESSHPNYSGVLGAYSKPNHINLDVDIGLNKKVCEGLSDRVETTIGICIKPKGTSTFETQ
ncbi:MAG: hypothetical protein MJK11_06290 [Pseudomonadales bacterium]|nr:hypothetical protein [Pseudomonadales bacterium]